MDEERDIHWSDQLEVLIAQEGERSRGLAWLHQRAEQIASRRNNYIQIPVIVLSTLAGTASVGSSSLFGAGSSGVSQVAIGFVSISVGILQTLGSYFSFARKSEAHNIAKLQYSKLFNWVSVELALPREERMKPQELLTQLRTAMERLAETTPSPPEAVLIEFNTKFKEYKDVSKPAETNGLARIKIYRRDAVVSIRSPLPTNEATAVLGWDDHRGGDAPIPDQQPAAGEAAQATRPA